MASDEDISIWYGGYGIDYFDPDDFIVPKNNLMQLNNSINVNKNYFIDVKEDSYDSDGYIRKIYVYYEEGIRLP